MPTATVTSKGQVTIPIEVRERLGIEIGSRVEFLQRADGSWEFATSGGTVASIRGMFAGRNPDVTLDDMRDAIADSVAERYRQQ